MILPRHLIARFQKKKVTEALSNPKGVGEEESPLITKIQKATIRTQIKNKQNRLGEDIDSFETSNPQISRLNSRIAQLKLKLSKKPDPNVTRQAMGLVAQKERLESQAAKAQMKNKNINTQKSNSDSGEK